MGKKWGSNADIRIGDIFSCSDSCDFYENYYQVVALKGKTQVVLRAIESESYINKGITEDSPLFWRRERERPLPGKFTERSALQIREFCVRGKYVRVFSGEITAWVLPDRLEDIWTQLQPVGVSYGVFFLCASLCLARPKDWEPWDAETIRKLEEYERQTEEVRRRHLHGEEDVPWPEYPI